MEEVEVKGKTKGRQKFVVFDATMREQLEYLRDYAVRTTGYEITYMAVLRGLLREAYERAVNSER